MLANSSMSRAIAAPFQQIFGDVHAPCAAHEAVQVNIIPGLFPFNVSINLNNERSHLPALTAFPARRQTMEI
jgi:hypothetical protein